MSRGVRTVSLAVLLCGACVFAHLSLSHADDKRPPAEPTVEELVGDLGSPVFTRRERAVERLWRRGASAVPALEKAANDPNPEVARRARELLDKFSWGVFPDTSPEVLKSIAQIRGGTPDERKAAFAALLKLGKPGRATARSILLKDLPSDTRNPLVTTLIDTLRHEVPLLLLAGKADEAGELLALHTTGTTPEGVADYAAFQVLRNTVAAAIAEAEADRKTARKPELADLVLAHLYRANRDWVKARKAAANLPAQESGNNIVDMLLEEEGNWAALLKTPPPGPLNLPDAFRISLLRLAGREKEVDTEVGQVRASVGDLFTREYVRDAAFTLLLNHRAGLATDLLLEKRQNLGLLSEILISQMRYKEALALVDPRKKVDEEFGAQEKLAFDLRRARVLALVGRKDESVQLFTQVAEGLKNLAGEARDWDDGNRARQALLRSELRVGFRDLACEHAALYVRNEEAHEPDDHQGETVFDLLFETDAAAAESLYRALRRRAPPKLAPGQTMVLVRQLMTGTAPKASVDEAMKAMAESSPPMPRPSDELAPVRPADRNREVARPLARAIVCRAARRHEEAEKAYKEAITVAELSHLFAPEEVSGARSWVFGVSDAARPWLEYGEFLDERGRFADAAVQFETGWKRYPNQLLLLFLSGKALGRAGNAKEGDRRMELAHWVGLGNERARGKFLEELVRRGEGKAAKRETDLLLRACWSRDFYFGNVMNQAARAAALSKDWPTAERCIQRSLFVLMKLPGAHFVDTSAYLNVPHEMLAFRARGLLAAGKVDAAVAQARACLEITPGHTDLVSGMVPDLDKRGRKKEADLLFGLVRDAFRKVLTDYPDSLWARNALASLGANCRRELDQSLAYATAAVAGDPKSTAFRSTLAEVQFRRGDRAKALELMTKLAEEHPRNHLYRRQLTRYKSGDIDSPFPETEDE